MDRWDLWNLRQPTSRQTAKQLVASVFQHPEEAVVITEMRVQSSLGQLLEDVYQRDRSQ